MQGLDEFALRWEDLSTMREKRTALHLRGLPRTLCEPGTLELLLMKYDLWHGVAGVRVLPLWSKKFGCAVIVAKSVDKVAGIAKFFHGCQFSTNCLPIAVSFARPTTYSSEVLMLDGQASSDCVESTASGSSYPASEGSDVIVEDSIRYPPGLAPPPGLTMMIGYQ